MSENKAVKEKPTKNKLKKDMDDALSDYATAYPVNALELGKLANDAEYKTSGYIAKQLGRLGYILDDGSINPEIKDYCMDW